MTTAQIHYELFVRRQPSAPWKLDMASESREQVTHTAETLLAERKVAAVRVTKELFDPDTGEFKSSTILTKGEIVDSKAKKPIENREPLCVAPGDLYSAHARDRIGRLLEGWLQRQKATPFELLHRPDLAERLDASGTDLQHAIQKIAVPEAQARGVSVHELMRTFTSLAERTIERIIKDKRRGALPDFAKEGFAKATERLLDDPERSYLLGAGVAAAISSARDWEAKVGKLLDLCDEAPTREPARSLAFHVIEQPLSEILESNAGLMDLLGSKLDLGGRLAAMTRLAAREAVDMLVGIEPSVARIMPPLVGAGARLAEWMAQPPFANARLAVAKRVLAELNGPRRLRPAAPREEIELLRALAMALTAATDKLLPAETVQEAFINRSKMLVTAEFVSAFLGENASAREEVEQLIRLVENVIGAANKRQAARWLSTTVNSLKLEKEVRYGPDSPATRLAAVASLQKALKRSGLAPEDVAPMAAKLGELGGLIEGDSRLCAALTAAHAPVMHRLTMLLKLAMGEAAPLGPAADRAKAAALKLLRSDELRAQFAQSPESLTRVKAMLANAGLAA